jgi:heme A synthase
MPVLPTFATPPTRPKRPSRVRPIRRPIDWCAHLITLAVLLLVYLAGYSGGRDASLSRAAAPLSPAANHPACHPNLKP